MDYVGPVYIYSKYDKFLFILATIDGTVIEQLFHVSRLKHGFFHLSNARTITNINDLPIIKPDTDILGTDVKTGVTASTCMAS